MAKRQLSSAWVDVSAAGALTIYGLYPTSEQDMMAFPIDGTQRDVTLPAGAVAMLVCSDADFVEGANPPNEFNNLIRPKGVIHSIPCAGRTVWHFKRSATSPDSGYIKGKILIAG